MAGALADAELSSSGRPEIKSFGLSPIFAAGLVFPKSGL